MNPEVIKAMQGKKTLKMQTWWHKNNYKVMRIILFPVWLGAILIDKYNILMNKNESLIQLSMYYKCEILNILNQ